MLERQFLEIMYIILEDGWQVPQGGQWLDILDYLNVFDPESQMCLEDNDLRDCFYFF